jgi:hypothetical protein
LKTNGSPPPKGDLEDAELGQLREQTEGGVHVPVARSLELPGAEGAREVAAIGDAELNHAGGHHPEVPGLFSFASRVEPGLAIEEEERAIQREPPHVGKPLRDVNGLQIALLKER